LLHLLSFATSFGSSLWVSFIGGIIMFKWVYYLFFPSSWRWTMCVCVCVCACMYPCLRWLFGD
jgi:phosphotransferase system  glucose/maltose/N-acetylglucosamine-specific IIC component